ncbi:MAG: hypothetical protein ABI898_12035 [Sphingomonadales bacterium]
MSRRSTSDVLAASLETALSRYFGDISVLTHKWVDWRSATFVGARHELRFAVDRTVAPKLEAITDNDLPLARGFVADLVVVAKSLEKDGLTVDLEVLTIAD